MSDTTTPADGERNARAAARKRQRDLGNQGRGHWRLYLKHETIWSIEALGGIGWDESNDPPARGDERAELADRIAGYLDRSMALVEELVELVEPVAADDGELDRSDADMVGRRLAGAVHRFMMSPPDRIGPEGLLGSPANDRSPSGDGGTKE